jgi:hypothetical protein
MNAFILTGDHKAQFIAAREALRKAGMQVMRSGYDYSLYYVHEGNKTTICSQSEIIEKAQRLQER